MERGSMETSPTHLSSSQAFETRSSWPRKVGYEPERLASRKRNPPKENTDVTERVGFVFVYSEPRMYNRHGMVYLESKPE